MAAVATRLETRSAQLSQLIEAANADQQRRIADRVAEAALAAAPLDEPQLAVPLADLRSGRRGAPALRDAEAVAQRLDEVAWDIQDSVDDGTASVADYDVAYRRARAASTLAFALSPDPRKAALEAAYEAEAATDDLRLISGIVHDVVGPPRK